jgi:hypothetical protein
MFFLLRLLDLRWVEAALCSEELERATAKASLIVARSVSVEPGGPIGVTGTLVFTCGLVGVGDDTV